MHSAHLVLNGLAARWLLRQHGLGSASATLAGLLAVSLPFVVNELDVLQLTAVFPLFIVLGAARSTFLHADWRAATALALGVLLTGLTCGYYFVFLSLLALPEALPFISRRTLSVKGMLRLLLPLAIAAGLLAPLLVGQAARLAGYTRLSVTIRNNSARWEDYLRAAPETIGARVFPALAGRGRSGQRLYPGTGLAVLALLGSAWLLRHRQYRLLISAWLLMAAGLVLSVGLRLEFDKWQPYAFLRQVHPGFSQLRSPFRAAVFVQIALVGLAGWGVVMLWRWRGRLGRVVAGSLVLVNFVEGWQLPARLYPYPEPQVNAEWVEWLADQPPGAVAMLPFPSDTTAADYQPTVVAMLQALQHGQPLVNGYSGWFPSAYRRLRRAVLPFPNARSLSGLCQKGAVYWVVALGSLSASERATVAEWPALYTGRDAVIYAAAERCDAF